MQCEHKEFDSQVTVNYLEDTGHYQADITINCSQCGRRFKFKGLPFGVDLNGAAMSRDYCEARLAIEPEPDMKIL